VPIRLVVLYPFLQHDPTIDVGRGQGIIPVSSNCFLHPNTCRCKGSARRIGDIGYTPSYQGRKLEVGYTVNISLSALSLTQLPRNPAQTDLSHCLPGLLTLSVEKAVYLSVAAADDVKSFEDRRHLEEKKIRIRFKLPLLE
jgi:hypothetical protein